MPWLTGGDPGAATICRPLDIPDDLYFRAAVRGAIFDLTRPENWEQFGALSPAEAAALAITMYEAFDDSQCVAAGGGDMEYIAELSGFAASYVFANLPQDFEQLILHCNLRSDRATSQGDRIGVRLNGDTGFNYLFGQTSINHSTGSVDGEADISEDFIEFRAGATAAGSFLNSHATSVMRLPNYRRANQWKAVTFDAYKPGNAASQWNVMLEQGYWNSIVTTVDEIEISPIVGSNFVAPSHVLLYGLRGAP